MWARLDATVSAVASEAGLDPDRVTQDSINIKRWINDTRREIHGLPTPLAATEFMGEFPGVLNVTAGTVTCTQNLAEVTGSSTAWTTAMGGRYLNVASGMWQKIAYVTDTTHLTLESGWPGTGTTGSNYIIWKRYYEIPHKVERILNIFDMGNARFPLAYYDLSEFYQKYGFGDAFNPPLAYTQFGSSEMGLAYLASTVYTGVTITANSPIIDFGAGAGIVTGLAPGDQLVVGNSTTSTAFNIDRVLTDTKAVLREMPVVSTATTSATALSSNRLLIQTYPAINNNNTYYFEAYKKCYDLINNADLIEQGWYMAVKKGAIAKALGYVRDPRENDKLKEYALEVMTLVRNHYKARNPAPRLKPYFPRRYGTGGFFGYFPSKYDTPG